MSDPYVIRGTRNRLLTLLGCLLFAVLAAVCFALVAFAYVHAGVFDAVSLGIGGIGLLMALAVAVRARDIFVKRVTVSEAGITIHGRRTSRHVSGEGLRLGIFTGRAPQRMHAGGSPNLSNIGSVAFSSSRSSSWSSGGRVDFFYLCAPDESPALFYSASAGSHESARMREALERCLGLTPVVLPPKPGTTPEMPDLSILMV